MGCSIGPKRVKGIICVKLFTIGAGIQLNSFGNSMGILILVKIRHFKVLI